eukprot:TRINITY_DN4520_c0_g5_i1.p1 TRINITY_DN4520_c0_g5~~TRINITY_DN4520_c0_g5_i1.p1  ORF type:complete len:226 (+),score=48.89 TRINITY_DN4520_c0_g5_i1:147-824(+)
MDRRTNYILYMIALSIYFGANLTLVILNSKSDEFLEKIDRKFHLMEFWTTSVFTILEFFLLASIETEGMLAFGVAVLNIIMTFVASVLVTMDTEEFEVTAHYFEYTAQVLIIPLDFVFILNEIPNAPSKWQKIKKIFKREVSLKLMGLIVFTLAVTLASIVLLIVYVISPDRFDKFSHYMEAVIETANAAVLIIVTYFEFEKIARYIKTPELSPDLGGKELSLAV